MNVKGTNGMKVQASLNESRETVLLEFGPATGGFYDQPVELDEHGLNLLSESLRSMAEEIKREREFNEAQRLMEKGGS